MEINEMANQEHLDILKQGVDAWNAWREQHPEVLPDFSVADLSKANLREVNFYGSYLYGSYFYVANLRNANLRGAYLSGAKLNWANLSGADLSWANLSQADLRGTTLVKTDLNNADLSGADLSGANLDNALSLKDINLHEVSGLTKDQLEICKAKGATIDEGYTTNSSQSTTLTPLPLQSNDVQTQSALTAQESIPTSDTSGSSAAASSQQGSGS